MYVLNHDVNFVSDDATQNALATDIIKKARQNQQDKTTVTNLINR